MSTYITFVGLGVRMLLHVLIEITLSVEDFVADIANMGLFLARGVLLHVTKQLIKRGESLTAHAAVRWMIVAVRSQMRRKIVFLIEAFIAERAF
jgi:hypothetical protein